MGTIDELVRDLRGVEDRREIHNELAKEIRKPVPALRKVIRARALATLPAGGGLGAWVAAASITARVQTSGRSAGVTLKASRKSASGAKSDLGAINRGRVRAPSWGRRGRGQWHNQVVAPGFLTTPAAELDQWRAAALTAIDTALARIRRG